MAIDQAGVLDGIHPAYLDGYQLVLYYIRSEDHGMTWLRSGHGLYHHGACAQRHESAICHRRRWTTSCGCGNSISQIWHLFGSGLSPFARWWSYLDTVSAAIRLEAESHWRNRGDHRQPCSYGAFCFWQGWNSSDVARPAPHAYVVNRRWRYVERAYGDNAVICGHRRHEYAGARQCRRHPRRVGESGWCIFGPLA